MEGRGREVYFRTKREHRPNVGRRTGGVKEKEVEGTWRVRKENNAPGRGALRRRMGKN